MRTAFPIRGAKVSSYTIPTEAPESDGTIEWSSTTLVLVELSAGGKSGMGFTYTHRCAAELVQDLLFPLLEGQDAFDIQRSWNGMTRAVRNLGRPGLAMMAISAVDFALWDLKARILGLPIHALLGAARTGVPVYGSGGFTSYTVEKLVGQLSAWAECGMRQMKMKVGRDPSVDLARVHEVRKSIGPSVSLFVDANGAYDRARALFFAERFGNLGVSWFEEPVSSDDLAGLKLLRDRAPGGMQIAAGEYGFDAPYFRAMLEAGAVDTLQADATRCGGITGFLQAVELAKAAHTPLSAHCAPSMHVALGCHSLQIAHLEFFYDHARIERMLFDGALTPSQGRLQPRNDQPGFGLELKRKDADAFAA